MVRNAVLWGFGLVLLAAFGCSHFRSAKPDGKLSVAENLAIADLPVPRGFKVDRARSFFKVNAEAGMRVISVTYKGRGKALAVLEFFRDNMPLSGWTLKEQSCTFGPYVLDFESETEAMQVRIVQGRFSTEFSISLNPKAGGG
ncbi:MAG: hypothetical protein J7M19_10220 [Planctomycetes bacterium]|nr:hypothetical protein [Planctomycetota bacterium]